MKALEYKVHAKGVLSTPGRISLQPRSKAGRGLVENSSGTTSKTFRIDLPYKHALSNTLRQLPAATLRPLPITNYRWF
jgi:hypothetical protein